MAAPKGAAAPQGGVRGRPLLRPPTPALFEGVQEGVADTGRGACRSRRPGHPRRASIRAMRGDEVESVGLAHGAGAGARLPVFVQCDDTLPRQRLRALSTFVHRLAHPGCGFVRGHPQSRFARETAARFESGQTIAAERAWARACSSVRSGARRACRELRRSGIVPPHERTCPSPRFIAVAQLNLTVGDLVGNADHIIAALDDARAAGAQLLLTPELALSGYPPEDLLLRPDYRACAREVERIAAAARGSRWCQPPGGGRRRAPQCGLGVA